MGNFHAFSAFLIWHRFCFIVDKEIKKELRFVDMKVRITDWIDVLRLDCLSVNTKTEVEINAEHKALHVAQY